MRNLELKRWKKAYVIIQKAARHDEKKAVNKTEKPFELQKDHMLWVNL